MQRNNVPPCVLPLTVEDARELLAKPLRRVCSAHGPKRVGMSIGGADEKTVRDARDEKSTLRLDYAVNLLALDGTALDSLLAHFGRRSAPIGAACSGDADRSRQSKVLAAALALSVALEDDDQVTPLEVQRNRETIIAARDALDALLTKIVRAA